MSQHSIAGRMAAASGIVTFCVCGRGYFAPFIGPVNMLALEQQATATRERADDHWRTHCGVAHQPEEYP